MTLPNVTFDSSPSKEEVADEAGYWRDLWRRTANGLLGAQADVERLTAERDKAISECREWMRVEMAERDRLRAALQLIIDGAAPEYRHDITSTIAREALAGSSDHSSSAPAGGQSHRAADETTAAPCDCNAEKWDGRHAGWCRAYQQSKNGEGSR